MSVKIDLSGKNILITGAGGSIGTEIVLKFLEKRLIFALNSKQNT